MILVPQILKIKKRKHRQIKFLLGTINIKNLIQLENGIEIDDNKIRVYLDEEELDKFSTNKEELEVCEKVYISSDILLTSEQEEIFENNNIEVYIIPEYYFEDEIKEVIRMTRLGQMLMDEGMELKETDSIKKLMKNMNWTIDQAMNALEVPEDKREKYRKTITPDN